MRIGEMANLLGRAPEILRHHDRLGLLPAPARNGARLRRVRRDRRRASPPAAGLRQLDLPLPVAAKLANMRAAGRCGEVSDELRAAIPAERAKLRRRIRNLRHFAERLALLERELREGGAPRQIIQLETRKVFGNWLAARPGCGAPDPPQAARPRQAHRAGRRRRHAPPNPQGREEGSRARGTPRRVEATSAGAECVRSVSSTRERSHFRSVFRSSPARDRGSPTRFSPPPDKGRRRHPLLRCPPRRRADSGPRGPRGSTQRDLRFSGPRGAAKPPVGKDRGARPAARRYPRRQPTPR